jgi:hypothetical protein
MLAFLHLVPAAAFCGHPDCTSCALRPGCPKLPGYGRIEAAQVREQASWGEVGTNLQR